MSDSLCMIVRRVFFLALCFCAAPGNAAELAGTVDWGTRLSMGTLVPGIVDQVEVSPGQRVKQGDRLLSLDQGAYRARMRGAEAELRRTGILVREARTEFERAQELYDRTVLSQHELAIAEVGLLEAQAKAAHATAGLAQARAELGYSQLSAPFDGLVVEVHALQGQAVNAEQGVPELLVLVDDRRVKVKARADLATLAELLDTTTLQVRLGGVDLPAEQVVAGYERLKSPPGQELFPVTVVVLPPQGTTVRAGQSARLIW